MNWKNINFFNKIRAFFQRKKRAKKDVSKNTKLKNRIIEQNTVDSSFKSTFAKSNGMYFFHKFKSLFRKKSAVKKETSKNYNFVKRTTKQVTVSPPVKETVAKIKDSTQKNKTTKKTKNKNRKNKKNKHNKSTSVSVTPISVAIDPESPILEDLDPVSPIPADPDPKVPMPVATRTVTPRSVDSDYLSPIPLDLDLETPTQVDLDLEAPIPLELDSIVPLPKTPALEPEVSLELPAQIKIVITGSVGAGKTTAIFSVSDKEPVTTESPPTDDVKNLKKSTTTSMDYGSFKKFDSKVHVYGTPGQKRFSFMSEVLTKGAGGLIILISNNQDDPLTELEYYLDNNAEFLTKNPAVIGITHLDVNSEHMSIYSGYMKKKKLSWPVIPIDARKKADVFELIDQVIQAKFGYKVN